MIDNYTHTNIPFPYEDASPLKQRAGEPLVDYHKRLVYGKLVDKTLSDADYTEIAEAVYGKVYSSDVARRMLYGSRYTYEELDKELLANCAESISEECGTEAARTYMSEIENKTVLMQKEAQKFSDQKREYKKLLCSESRFEHLEAVIAEAASRMCDNAVKYYNNDYCPQFADSETEAVLVFSDWHYGLTADNIFNKFNTDICIERINTVIKKAAVRLTKHKCGELHIIVLGDLIHGAIHTSTRVASEELACDQLMHASELLAQAIDYLSQFVPHVTVRATYGNHGRTVQNKNDSVHRDNFERIVTWWLKERFKDKKDKITIADESDNEFLVFDVCGHGFCASHGDLDNVHNATRTLSTLINKTLGVKLEYILLGDKHHRESFDEIGVTASICGALCGTDDYANDKRLYSTPSQLLLIVDRNYGVDAEYRLKCE